MPEALVAALPIAAARRHAVLMILGAACLFSLAGACVKTLGGSPDSVDIIFRDVERHDWTTGGRLWSDPAPPKPAGG